MFCLDASSPRYFRFSSFAPSVSSHFVGPHLWSDTDFRRELDLPLTQEEAVEPSGIIASWAAEPTGESSSVSTRELQSSQLGVDFTPGVHMVFPDTAIDDNLDNLSTMAMCDISDVPVESVFCSLPAVQQDHQRKLLELFAAPGVQLKKRMGNIFFGVMEEKEQYGHLEHLNKRMCSKPADCDLSPSTIELEFDEFIVPKFEIRKQQLQQEVDDLSQKKTILEAMLTADCEELEPKQQIGEEIQALSKKKLSLEATLSNVCLKLSMEPAVRIRELYRKGFLNTTKQHKETLRKFARVLGEAIFEFLPELAEQYGLDMAKLMENVSIHDFNKILQSAAFGGNTYDKDLGSTYVNFKDKYDPALALFFNACLVHGVIEGSREHGHHPHGAAGLTDSASSEKLRAFLLSGPQDINKKVEAMADTLDAAFTGRILKSKADETNSNAWLVFSATEFFPGGNQEVPVEELVMRYRFLLTNASLKTLEECQEAVSYVAEDGNKKLMTTAMLKAISPIFARMASLGETM